MTQEDIESKILFNMYDQFTRKDCMNIVYFKHN